MWHFVAVVATKNYGVRRGGVLMLQEVQTTAVGVDDPGESVTDAPTVEGVDGVVNRTRAIFALVVKGFC